MLDNEPKSGADGTAATTETTENTAVAPPAGDGGVRVTTPAPAKGARRAAGPPPEPADVFTPPTTPSTKAAGSGEGGTVNTSSRTPVRKRTVRAAGRPEDAPAATSGRRTRTAAEDDTSRDSARESAPTRGSAGDKADAEESSSRGRTRSRTRTRAPKTVEAPAPDTVEVEDEVEEQQSATETTGAVFSPPGGMLFQPPVAQQNVPAKARKAVETRDEETGDDSDAEAQAPAEETGTDERPSRRRRRRGGRGRGRSRGPEENDSEDTDAVESDEGGAKERHKDTRGTDTKAGKGRDETSADSDDDSDDDDEHGSSRRRRRRRRRSGSGSASGSGSGSSGNGESTSDDPPNTVVKVREPRQERPIEDEVQAVRGSTRLEAKKQRRREGREQGRRRAPIVTESEFLARREAVKRDLVIRSIGDRTQIATLEDDVLVEHYVDRATHRSYVGNVYLGRVQNVLPSMEAAFVDIGKGRNAVLYAGEVNWDSFGLEGQPKRIESVLKSGQSVLVQVTKDPVGHKGARLTSQISLPGRYLVYVPGGSMTGISRKLPDKERARLKQILKKVMPSGAGVIVRTAAEGASEEELERDITRLTKQWDSIKRKSKSASAPSLLNSEPDLTIRVVRDVFNEDFSSLVVSGDEAWNTVHEYVDYVAPHLAERLSHWSEDGDVFSAYRIDEQINKALERKVWLPSGGSLIIDRTEAMTVVDVNTGKFTGQGGNLEETVTKNNLEAAEETVRQLRLRDIGGIIVIDFIDMVLESNRDLVLRRMLECLSRDRTKHQVAEVTSLGLVQMTRKRVGQGLLEAFSHNCDHCNGRGLVLSSEPVENKGGGNGGGNGNGNGNGRKKKKGKGDAEPAADTSTDKGDKAEKSDKPEQPADKNDQGGRAAEIAEDAAEQDDKPAKRTRSRKGTDKASTSAQADMAEAAAEPTVNADEGGAEGSDGSAEEAPAKRTRKRPSRAKKAAEETVEAAQAADAAPAAAEASSETAETPVEEAPAKRTRRRTTTRKAAEADSGEGEQAKADGDESDSADAGQTPADGDAEGTTERPKRRRTRRTKTAVTSPTGGSSVDAG
ncbi:Rne/Rng family ribonuclease [Nocardiopsis sp. JB363]|uniref:Rne/Rng family ribonuclease n=1 Tax=Nocardiopsis sp. JB363 TaxID=1434837 RepID=UPI00097A5A46|nr:Rne/Rng family ribonuclease [Nocardiopsis sp. JB363]SIO89678.1 Cytoplasmic axial filament protein CafA and Ribonuclease G [Nocardiopsis sp. JB363]